MCFNIQKYFSSALTFNRQKNNSQFDHNSHHYRWKDAHCKSLGGLCHIAYWQFWSQSSMMISFNHQIARWRGCLYCRYTLDFFPNYQAHVWGTLIIFNWMQNVVDILSLKSMYKKAPAYWPWKTVFFKGSGRGCNGEIRLQRNQRGEIFTRSLFAIFTWPSLPFLLGLLYFHSVFFTISTRSQPCGPSHYQYW